jgi:hypothetical protein
MEFLHEDLYILMVQALWSREYPYNLFLYSQSSAKIKKLVSPKEDTEEGE